MSYSLEFKIEGLPRTANGSHGHWRSKAAETKRWKQATFASAWPSRPTTPLEQAKLTLTRHSSSQPDYDGLVHSFKAIIDGLRQAKVLADDKIMNIGRPEYLWVKCAPKLGHVTIKVQQTTKEQL